MRKPVPWDNRGMPILLLAIPNPTHLAALSMGFAVAATFITLAQRIGDWRSEPVGVALGTVGGLLALGWAYFAFLWIFQINLLRQSVTVYVLIILALVGLAAWSFHKRWFRGKRQVNTTHTEVNAGLAKPQLALDVPIPPPKPKVIIEWVTSAQFSHFQLSNRGDGDATDVLVNGMTSGLRQLQFVPIDLIKAGDTAYAEIRSVWIDKDGGPPSLLQGPLAPDRGNHRAAIMWLWGGDRAVQDIDSCPDLNSPYIGDVAIWFRDENGIQQSPRFFIITIWPVSWRVSVLPKQTLQSPEST